MSAGEIAASYDQGMDIQPNTSWAHKDSINSTAQQLEQNLNPVDKEDPSRQTKALPFAASNSHEVQQEVQQSSNMTQERSTQQQHSDTQAQEDHEEVEESDYHGNILDRTMDKVRSWVHSYQPHSSSSSSSSSMDHADEREDSLSFTVSTAKSKLLGVKDQVSSGVSHLSENVSGVMSGVSHNVSGAVGQVQHKANAMLHTVQDRATNAVENVKTQVTDFVHSHQSQPGEPLSTTISHQITSALPSQQQLQDKASFILPPLAEEATTSYAFLTSFLNRYVSTYKDFGLALQRQSYPLQFMTLLLLVTHFVEPIFFFDKGAARSVMYCYIISSVLSHLTFFLSGHLRYLFLAHLVFIPMLFSLTLHAGFDEAGTVSHLMNTAREGQDMKAAFIAPLTLRSYLFILWLRVVMMVQASVLTLDAVNVLELLGLSLNTRSGQEMIIIKRRVKQMRRQLAHSIEPPSMAAQHQVKSSNSGSTQTQSGEHSTVSASSPNIPGVSSSSSSAPVHHQKWVKKDSASSSPSDAASDDQVTVQSVEKEDQGLRHRHAANVHEA